MQKFPNEEERSAEIQANLRDQFEYCEQIYRYWLEAEKDHWVEKVDLDPRICVMIGVLHVQSFRLFRSIIEQCRRGEAFGARIHGRSLFETVAALLFILKPVVCIRLEPVPKNGARKLDADGRPASRAVAISRAESVAKDRLSRELRSLLYMGHSFIENEEFLKRCGTTDGLKTLRRGFKAAVNPAEIARIESDIGLEWSYVLRNPPYSYSGLKIKPLVKMLNKQMLKWYHTIYNFQSRDVHAANALDHLKFEGDVPELLAISSDDEVKEALQGAVIQLRAVMAIMEDYVGFGPGNPSALAWFSREYDRVFRRNKR